MANPALSSDIFDIASAHAPARSDRMTVEGTAYKTLLLVAIAMVAAGLTWTAALASPNPMAIASPAVTVGGIGGFITAMVTIFKKDWAQWTAPVYALFEGAALGALSFMFEIGMPGIAMQAFLLTSGTLFGMLVAYTTGTIQVTQRLRSGIIAATAGIMVTYLVSFVLGFFGMGVPFIHDNGLMGIGFSVFVVGIAAFNLLLDFDFIEHGARVGAPKQMEWYGAFGLMVTLVWLYIEFLRLLSKLRDD